MTTYDEKQKQLVADLIETQSYVEDDPFGTYEERKSLFSTFLYTDSGLPCCGCGDPESTLLAIVNALTICSMDGVEERKALMQEKFKTEYVSNDPLLQMLFYVLDEAGYTTHGGSINYCWLTDAGKVMLVLLKRFLEIDELTGDQIFEGNFEIDFETILAPKPFDKEAQIEFDL